MLKQIPDEYRLKFEPSMKVGLLATINPEGFPHITLITSIQAGTPVQVIWGEFINGLSKEYVEKNNKTGFLIMTLQKELWRGKAVWTHKRKEGEEYEMFNKKPLYRYNSYCGISTVHYMDLVELSEKSGLNMASIAKGAILTKLSKGGLRQKENERVLKPWAEELFNTIGNLKFLSYIGEDGFPEIIPVFQSETAGSSRIVFSCSPYKDELKKIPEGAKASIFGMTLNMEDVLVLGRFGGFKRSGLVTLGVLDIEKVYNSMPPKHGFIYPEEKPIPVTEF